MQQTVYFPSTLATSLYGRSICSIGQVGGGEGERLSQLHALWLQMISIYLYISVCFIKINGRIFAPDEQGGAARARALLLQLPPEQQPMGSEATAIWRADSRAACKRGRPRRRRVDGQSQQPVSGGSGSMVRRGSQSAAAAPGARGVRCI